MLALGAAAAAQERRASRTSLETSVPAFFGLRRPLDVTFAVEHRRIPRARLRELTPLTFAAAADGDAVARGIVDRIADEIVAHAAAAVRRLRLSGMRVPVVLSGGLFGAKDSPFLERIRAGIWSVAPAADVRVLDVPPVVGAALLGLDTLGSAPAARERLRRTFPA